MKQLGELMKDKERVSKLMRLLRAEGGSLLVDYTKTHIEEGDIKSWEERLEGMQIGDRVKEMFSGQKINYTEDRPVLHVKLRSQNVIAAMQKESSQGLDPEEEAIAKELLSLKRIAESFTNGTMMGASGKPIKNVVNIGIGGSDLGPRLLTAALAPLSNPKGSLFRYVSNVDAQEMHACTADLSLEETVFVIVSKTFTTQETLENARIALQKVIEAHPGKAQQDVVRAHFLAVTAAKQKATAFGILEENILDMWDFVGGRYSLWSCVSLSSALAMGFPAFLEMLAGAAAMDNHFLNTPVRDNLPMFHAMVECKYFNEYGFNNKCVVPYDHYLKLLPAYLQQCEMESNGKSCTKDGSLLLPERFISSGVDTSKQTAPIVWGGVGTDVQHSYFQLLHQGTIRVLTEFLIPANPKISTTRASSEAKNSTAHDVLIANCLAQSRALMLGRDNEDKNKYFTGNRPSITLIYDQLSPFTLGLLIALYEHKIFVQGLIWNINSYDQFGVELGKVLAKEILSQVEQQRSSPDFDPSTTALLQHYYSLRKK
ncbi:glucose-6-phosphate isomerase [Nematocida homosporus]|uniref:glucose-6-phosphate isomerase n=1 Tax=Nematocida homosporus TaxID=1912981 RepID=UPI00221FFF44|nr:glucose-6-phosphate isomerase [Nematocida homosporus]KAI5185252.1 glucose-6-phosphate isomerase [Nematocida homosporus]